MSFDLKRNESARIFVMLFTMNVWFNDNYVGKIRTPLRTKNGNRVSFEQPPVSRAHHTLLETMFAEKSIVRIGIGHRIVIVAVTYLDFDRKMLRSSLLPLSHPSNVRQSCIFRRHY